MSDKYMHIEKVEQLDDLYEKRTFYADQGQEPMRVDKWVHMRLEGISRNKVQQFIDTGFLTVNGKAVKQNYRIKPGDIANVILFQHPDSLEVTPEDIPLNIVYEDDDVIVVNKPPNMVVHPAIGNFTGTLLNGIAYHFKQQQLETDEDSLPRYGMVHRIDKNTTGLLVLAKNLQSSAHLAKQFFHHTVIRRYNALVWGNVEHDEGTIKAHVGRHPYNKKQFAAYPDGEYGKHATTHYKVLERFHYVTLIECKLETGRTHQIRVHLKHLGHTLFNDVEYGGEKILKGTIYSKYKQFVEQCFKACPRCALHARILGFTHPRTGKPMYFESELPNDIQEAILLWRNYANELIYKK